MKKWKAFFEEEHTPCEYRLLCLCVLLGGIILGFLLSPVKKGVTMGCNNGCDNVITENKNGKKESEKGKLVKKA